MPNWFDHAAVRAIHDGGEAMRHEVLRILRRYLAAYPEDVFPDPGKGQHGKTVDCCHARALRIVLARIIAEVEAIGKDA